jgi:hypothetical protein
MCGSIVLLPKQNWEEWWMPALHIGTDDSLVVDLREDVSDFNEKLYEIETNFEKKIQKISKLFNLSMKLFNEVTIDCYYYKLIQGAANAWGAIGDSSGRIIPDTIAELRLKDSI